MERMPDSLPSGLEILLCLFIDRCLLHGLLIEGKVVGGHFLRLQRLAFVGVHHTLQEHIRRQSVIDDVVNVSKEIDILWRLIDFNTVEPVVEQIEGSHPLTEERLVGLFIQCLNTDHGLLVIVTFLPSTFTSGSYLLAHTPNFFSDMLMLAFSAEPSLVKVQTDLVVVVSVWPLLSA